MGQKFSTEIRKKFELNENENTTKFVWCSLSNVSGEFIAQHTYVRKNEVVIRPNI